MRKKNFLPAFLRSVKASLPLEETLCKHMYIIYSIREMFIHLSWRRENSHQKERRIRREVFPKTLFMLDELFRCVNDRRHDSQERETLECVEIISRTLCDISLFSLLLLTHFHIFPSLPFNFHPWYFIHILSKCRNKWLEPYQKHTHFTT